MSEPVAQYLSEDEIDDLCEGLGQECLHEVVVGYSRHYGQIVRSCGTWYAGETVLCDNCRKHYTKLYPQGWRGYPGDICKHGRYTGGCGADLMCSACEMGEDN